MLTHFLLSLAIALAASGQTTAQVETFDLGSGRSVRGELVKENAETLFVDLGYTILEVPRKEVVARRTEAAAPENGGAGSAATTNAAPTNAAHGADGALWTSGGFGEASVRTCAERVGSGVVLVKVPGALGSGFVVHPDGWIVTNAHVVAKEQEITVTVFEKSSKEFEKKLFDKVELVAINPYWDLALLRIPKEKLGDYPLSPTARRAGSASATGESA